MELSHLEEQSNTTHVIVKFKEELNEDGQLLVELVPKSWLGIKGEDWFCAFPPKEHYDEMLQWISLSRHPEATWETFPIDIIAYADNFSQGLRRIQKSYTQSLIESSSEQEIVKIPVSSPAVATISQARKILHDIKENKNLKSRRKRAISSSSDSSASASPNKKFAGIDSLTSTPKSRCQINSLAPLHTPKHISAGLSLTANISPPGTPRELNIEQQSSSVNEDIHQLPPNNILNKDDANHMVSITEVETRITKAIYDATEEVEIYIEKCVGKARRSLQYDFNKKIDTLINNLMLNQDLQDLDKFDLVDVQSLGVPMPAKTLDDFITFENMIIETKEKLTDIVKKYMLKKVVAQDMKKTIAAILGSLITKEVQLQYSGQGKLVSGMKKRDFSKTETYKLLEGIVSVQCKVTPTAVLKQIGIWLAGAKDREGGRKERDEKKNQQNSL